MDITISTEHHVGRLVYLDEDWLERKYLRAVSEKRAGRFNSQKTLPCNRKFLLGAIKEIASHS